jgi:ornithine cyclodeaminase/alanine dehydrogenase-like protein (mu-crystallin family)
MVLLLSDADVRHAIPMGDAVGVVEQALRQYASGPQSKFLGAATSVES